MAINIHAIAKYGLQNRSINQDPVANRFVFVISYIKG